MSNPFAGTVDDNYNPFAAASQPLNTNTDTTYTGYTGYSAPASTTTSSSTTDATYVMPSFGDAGSGQVKDKVTGVNISEAELAAREAALQRREELISEKERAIANGTYVPPKTTKNFPPLLHLWEYYPDEELPQQSVKLVKQVMWTYIITAISLFVNAVGSLFCLFPGPNHAVDSAATQIVLSLVYLIVFVPISFEFSFFVLYNSIKEGKGLKFFCYFITYFIWFAFNVFLLIGLIDGSLGYIKMIDIFGADENAWVGIVALIFDIVDTLCCVAMAYTAIALIRYYKSNGLQKQALQEASVMAANYAKENPDVAREVATTMKGAYDAQNLQ